MSGALANAFGVECVEPLEPRVEATMGLELANAFGVFQSA
jgi:hypothetical protein